MSVDTGGRRAAGRATLAAASVLVGVAMAVVGLDWVPDQAAPTATPPPGNPGPDAINVGPADASELAVGTSGLWLLNHHNDRRDELVRVDPGAGMAVDGGLIWLSDPARGRLLRIGPALLGNP